MRQRLPALLLVSLLVVSCRAGGDDRQESSDPGATTPDPTAADDARPGVAAERIDATEIGVGRRDRINDLVATDALPPTAVGSTTEDDGTGVLPVIWELGAEQSWARHELPLDGATRAFVTDAAALDRVRLAVGGHEVDGRFRATAWTRRDGRWSRSGPGISAEDGSSGIGDVAAHGEVAVAIGTVDPPGPEPSAERNRVWTSSDGAAWDAADPEPFGRDGTRLTDVAAGPGGLVVVGRVADGTTTSPRAWWSPDGAAWEAVEVGGGAGSTLESVVPFGDGFVAGGAVTPGINLTPAVWRSPDGRSWGPPTTDLPVRDTGTVTSGGASIDALTSRRGVVAATNGLDTTPEVWRSTDGERWSSWGGSLTDVVGYDPNPAPLDVALDGRGQPVLLVSEGPNLLIPTDDTWAEAPGVDDALVLDTERVTIHTAVLRGGALLLVGGARLPIRPGAPQRVQSVVWRQRTTDGWHRDDPPSLADRIVVDAVGTDVGVVTVGYQVLSEQGGDDALVAVGNQAGDWPRVVDLEALAARYLADVARWRGGWLAVGDATPLDPTRTNGTARRRALVQGSDAATGLRQLPLDGLPLDPSQDQSLRGICTSGRGAIIVGADIGGPSGTRPLVAHATDPAGTWTVATADDDFAAGRPGSTLADCAADGRGHHLLHGRVTAGDGQPEPLAWHSEDGTTWQRVRSDAWGGDGAQAVAAVAGLDEGWLAVGTDAPEGADGDVAIWHVGADLEVTRVPLAGDLVGVGAQAVTSVVTRGDEVIITGSDDGGPAVWVLSLDEVLSSV